MAYLTKENNLSSKLWASNLELANASLNSEFVQGIKLGNLPLTCFQKFIAQDFFFLKAFSESYVIAISKSKDESTIKQLNQLL